MTRIIIRGCRTFYLRIDSTFMWQRMITIHWRWRLMVTTRIGRGRRMMNIMRAWKG